MKPKSSRNKQQHQVNREGLIKMGFVNYYTVDGIESWNHPLFTLIDVSLNPNSGQYCISLKELAIDFNVGCLQL